MGQITILGTPTELYIGQRSTITHNRHLPGEAVNAPCEVPRLISLPSLVRELARGGLERPSVHVILLRPLQLSNAW